MKKLVISVLAVSAVCCAHSTLAVSLNKEERLGKLMYQDKNFSYNATQSCQSCHHRTAGFADPTNARDPSVTVVSLGADGVSLGGRNAPSAAYTGYSPPLYQDGSTLEWYGGLFWDGRADGSILGDPLAEQAQGPPLNPVEMNMADAEAVVQAVRDSDYVQLFYQVYGQGSLADTGEAFNLIARAIATYERSVEVQPFNSRFDRNELTPREVNGLQLFAQHCTGCHAMDTAAGRGPLFTDYGYRNIGIPANPLVPLIEPDLGLGYTVADPAQNGKFKVPTLRNVGISAPYGHNGYFPTLRDIVSFKNDAAQWPAAPEVPYNIAPEIGAMGLDEAQVDDLVAFLMSLTDTQP